MQNTLRLASCHLALAGLLWCAVVAAADVDKYGGFMDVKGTPGESFSVQQFGGRWWIVTPDGHGTFIRAVSKVDTNNNNVDCGGSGNFLSYDAVYIQPKGGQPTANLKDAAASTITKDVVDPKSGVTLHDAGDALFIGSARFKPNFTYFWLDQLGAGGKVQWYYSAGTQWKLINGNGNPFACAAKSADGSCSFDRGNFMAPDARGDGVWYDPNRPGTINAARANKITWFDAAKAGFPADFSPTALPHDPTPRYYLKAIVTRAFSTAPVLNQAYDRATFDEIVQRKYGPGPWNVAWAKAVTERLQGWGYNAAGMYSGRYVIDAAPKLGDRRLPGEPTWVLGGAAMKKGGGYEVKNVYSGAIFPPGSGQTGWHGVQPDVFDPLFEKAYRELAAKELPKLDPWSWSLITEEADYLFGLNSLTHDHLGYVVLSHNPYRATDAFDKITYTDTKFYAKYALRDFLRDRYQPAGGEKWTAFTIESKVPAYSYAAAPGGPELAALHNLNKAWDTNYTTWGTSAGDLEKGNNAYGAGRGFMDENGAGVLAKGVRDAAFKTRFTRADSPAIRVDLDDFLALFAARYGKVLAGACNQGRHPPLILPLYQGPDIVYKAVAPYVDGFWFSSHSLKADALRIYRAGHKPVIAGDYIVANPDSPSYFKAKIEKIRFDGKKTIVYAPAAKYNFRSIGYFLCFPDSPDLQKAAVSRGVITAPRAAAIRWNTFEFDFDYTPYVKAGDTIAFYGGYRGPETPPMPATQEERARRMIESYDSLLNLQGDDGNRFVMGLEHWCLYDDGVNNWAETDNFGIATLQDNAYDGVEARRAAGKDARGYMVGGEEADYGNLLGPLGEYLRAIPGKIKR